MTLETDQTSCPYDPFGKDTASGASSINPFQFTDRENDGTGIYYYRARYCGPTFQQFIAQDPIGFADDDANLYAHAVEKPAGQVIRLAWSRLLEHG